MTDITVRVLGEDDWAEFKDVRLAALADSPEAFAATRADEQDLSDEQWQARLQRSPRFLAERDGEVLGTASLGTREIDEGQTHGEIFGLWVTPRARGTGVATALARAAAKAAQDRGRSHIVYWVSTDNGRAVAFASGLGFRPTDQRRPMKGSHHADETEVAMVLPLGPDRGGLPDLS